MKKLNDTCLLPGDIILTSAPEKMSRVVRRMTKSEISHALIYVQHCSVIDSTMNGVQSGNTQRMFFDGASTVVVLRPKVPLSSADILKITDFARAATGSSYAKIEAATILTKKYLKTTRKQFCSRLVARAFAAAGIRLVLDPDYCSPQDLRESDLLYEVPDVLIEVTESEVRFWQNRPDLPKLMADATNNLLAFARKKNPEILHLNDIISHLLAHPDDDDYFLKAYKRSGYLTVYEVEIQKSAWHYDFDLMQTLVANAPESADQIDQYCRDTVAGQEDGRRFHVNWQQTEELSRITGLKTFIRLAELYRTLSAHHELRVSTARRRLRMTVGVNAEIEMDAPPNSPAWLSEVEKRDFRKAAHTREIVSLAKSELVCSICGDDPAANYVLEGNVPERSLRLCDDCLKIRGLSGESFVPLAVDGG